MNHINNTWKKHIPAFLAATLIILLWEISSGAGLISRLLFPSPSRIFLYFLESLGSGEIFRALGVTLIRLVTGFVAGAVPGLILGWRMSFSHRLRNFAEPFIAAFYPMPKIAIFPFIMFIFGIGESSKVVAVGVTAFFPILINTMAGVQQINPVYLHVAQNYGAGRWKTFTTVVFPASLPWILAGARIALNTSFMVVIAVELLAARSGLGVLIWFGWETLNTLKLYTALGAIALVGVLINLFFSWLFTKYLPWHQAFGWESEYPKKSNQA
ncbi:MAG TPA: ABC transporter permease [Anaerolineales bacterium]|nr:ABC transporter permease [Anaerolineales bacterium]